MSDSNFHTVHSTTATLILDKWTLRLMIILLILQVMLSAVLLYQFHKMRQDVAWLHAVLIGPSLGQSVVVDVEVDDDDPMRGAPDAPVTIVEFSSFDCSYCAQVADVMQEVFTRYPNQVRLIYRDFPMGPSDSRAAEAAQCANEQGMFWEMHDWLFEERNRRSDEDYITAARTLGLDVTAFSECLSEGRYEEEIAADREAGGSYGVLGTPTLFVNRRRVDGAVPAATFLEIVKEELNSVK